MIYISLDIETTGVDIHEDTDDILEFSCIVEDTDNKKSFNDSLKFTRFFKHDKIQGNPYAIDMNQNLIKQLAQKNNELIYDTNLKYHNYDWATYDTFKDDFFNWLEHNGFKPNYYGKIGLVAGGKNVSSFDIAFLNKLTKLDEKVYFKHRVLDPGTCLIDFTKDDVPPDLALCKERVGISDTEVSHNALEDSWDVIQVLRKHFKY